MTAKSVLQAADDRPVITAFVVWIALLAALLIWDELQSGPVLLGIAARDHRTDIYGEIASSSVGILAVALTVLSILVALPDEPRVHELRQQTGWRLLQAMLLAAALLCLIALVSAHVGAAVDRAAPIGWLEQLTLASAIVGVLTLAVAGGAFALLLRAIRQPPDPSAGRGGLGLHK
jgi:hypothetical protein